MTIRFAAALNGTVPAVCGVICKDAPLGAANDNAVLSPRILRTLACEDTSGEDARLAEALMHFARHGLSAARRAAEEAEVAGASRQPRERARWLDICGRFDPRLAAATAARLVI